MKNQSKNIIKVIIFCLLTISNYSSATNSNQNDIPFLLEKVLTRLKSLTPRLVYPPGSQPSTLQYIFFSNNEILRVQIINETPGGKLAYMGVIVVSQKDEVVSRQTFSLPGRCHIKPNIIRCRNTLQRVIDGKVAPVPPEGNNPGQNKRIY